jgi:hypothetical protein
MRHNTLIKAEKLFCVLYGRACYNTSKVANQTQQRVIFMKIIKSALLPIMFAICGLFTECYSAKLDGVRDYKGIRGAIVESLYRVPPQAFPEYDFSNGGRLLVHLPGKPRNPTRLFNIVNDFVHPGTGHILVSIPDLHGAYEIYLVLIELINFISAANSTRQIFLVFPGDFASKGDPYPCEICEDDDPYPYKPDAEYEEYEEYEAGKIVENAKTYLGNFCTSCILPILQLHLSNVHIIATQGNHEMQNTWRFLQTARFFRKHHIPFLSPYTDWIRQNWADVTPPDRWVTGIMAECGVGVEALETAASYGLSDDFAPDFNPTDAYHVTGNTLFWPWATAVAASGGENGLSECYVGDLVKRLRAVHKEGSLGPDDWTKFNAPNVGTFRAPNIRMIARNWRAALCKLYRYNPTGPLNVVIPSHATLEQTKAFFECMFARYPDTLINEHNFPGANRMRFLFFGGHRHEDKSEEIVIKMGRGELRAIFCAASIFGQSINCAVLEGADQPFVPARFDDLPLDPAPAQPAAPAFVPPPAQIPAPAPIPPAPPLLGPAPAPAPVPPDQPDQPLPDPAPAPDQPVAPEEGWGHMIGGFCRNHAVLLTCIAAAVVGGIILGRTRPWERWERWRRNW